MPLYFVSRYSAASTRRSARGAARTSAAWQVLNSSVMAAFAWRICGAGGLGGVWGGGMGGVVVVRVG